MLLGKVSGPESAHSGRRQQQRIFDPGADSPQALAEEALEEAALLRIGRRHEQPGEQGIDVIAPEWPLDRRVVGHRQHRRVERAPQQSRLALGVGGQVDDRGSARDRQQGDLTSAAAPARRKPVPDRDQDVAVSDRRAAGHDISIELARRVAGKLEHAGRFARSAHRTARARRGWRGSRDSACGRMEAPPAIPSRAQARPRLRSGRRRRRSATRSAWRAAHPRTTPCRASRAWRRLRRSTRAHRGRGRAGVLCCLREAYRHDGRSPPRIR